MSELTGVPSLSTAHTQVTQGEREVQDYQGSKHGGGRGEEEEEKMGFDK